MSAFLSSPNSLSYPPASVLFNYLMLTSILQVKQGKLVTTTTTTKIGTPEWVLGVRGGEQYFPNQNTHVQFKSVMSQIILREHLKVQIMHYVCKYLNNDNPIKSSVFCYFQRAQTTGIAITKHPYINSVSFVWLDIKPPSPFVNFVPSLTWILYDLHTRHSFHPSAL